MTPSTTSIHLHQTVRIQLQASKSKDWSVSRSLTLKRLHKNTLTFQTTDQV